MKFRVKQKSISKIKKIRKNKTTNPSNNHFIEYL